MACCEFKPKSLALLDPQLLKINKCSTSGRWLIVGLLINKDEDQGKLPPSCSLRMSDARPMVFPHPVVGTLQIKQGQTRSLLCHGDCPSRSPVRPTFLHLLALPRMASTAAPPQLSALDTIFQGLRNKNHDVRLRAAEDLKQYVSPPPLSGFFRVLLLMCSSGNKCCGRDVF